MKVRIVAVVGCAAMAVAACGSAPASARRPGGPATPARLATSARPAQSPRQVAEATVTRMLAEFRPPPGAKRSGPANVPVLSGPLDTQADPDVTMRTLWWRAPGTMRGVLAWIAAREPASLGRPLAGSGGAGRAIVAEESYSAPPDPGVIRDGFLNIWVAADGADSVAIRADSEVAWFPAKPPSERIPAAARVVTVAALPAQLQLPGQPAATSVKPVTVTNPATVRTIVALVDDLPRMPLGVMSCAAGGGPGLRLTFRAAVRRPVLAQVTYDGGGCGAIAIVVGGKQMPALWYGPELEQQVLKLTGLGFGSHGTGNPQGRVGPTRQG